MLPIKKVLDTYTFKVKNILAHSLTQVIFRYNFSGSIKIEYSLYDNFNANILKFIIETYYNVLKFIIGNLNDISVHRSDMKITSTILEIVLFMTFMDLKNYKQNCVLRNVV